MTNCNDFLKVASNFYMHVYFQKLGSTYFNIQLLQYFYKQLEEIL